MKNKEVAMNEKTVKSYASSLNRILEGKDVIDRQTLREVLIENTKFVLDVCTDVYKQVQLDKRNAFAQRLKDANLVAGLGGCNDFSKEKELSESESRGWL